MRGRRGYTSAAQLEVEEASRENSACPPIRIAKCGSGLRRAVTISAFRSSDTDGPVRVPRRTICAGSKRYHRQGNQRAASAEHGKNGFAGVLHGCIAKERRRTDSRPRRRLLDSDNASAGARGNARTVRSPMHRPSSKLAAKETIEATAPICLVHNRIRDGRPPKRVLLGTMATVTSTEVGKRTTGSLT